MSLPYSLRGGLLRRHRHSCSTTLTTQFPMTRTTTLKVVKNMIEGAGAASDRETDASSAWVEWPSGRGAGATLAHWFLAAGEVAFRWNTRGKKRRPRRLIPRSRRTHRELSCRDRRQQLGVGSATFSSLGDAEEGRKSKQDKGSVSRPCVSDCLHILFSGDGSLRLRDSSARNGENPSFPPGIRETSEHFDA